MALARACRALVRRRPATASVVRVAGAQLRWHGGAGDFDASAADVRVIFVAGDGSETEVKAKAGQDLLDVAHRNEVDLEGACEGSIACSTCHVILEDGVFDSLEEATEEEVRRVPARRGRAAWPGSRQRALAPLLSARARRTTCSTWRRASPRRPGSGARSW